MMKLAIILVTFFIAFNLQARIKESSIQFAMTGKTSCDADRTAAMAKLQGILFEKFEQHCKKIGLVADLTSLIPTTLLYLYSRYTEDKQKQYQIALPNAKGLCIAKEL